MLFFLIELLKTWFEVIIASLAVKYFADAKIQLQWVFQMFEKFAEKSLDDSGKRFQVSPSGSITVFQLFTFRYIELLQPVRAFDGPINFNLSNVSFSWRFESRSNGKLAAKNSCFSRLTSSKCTSVNFNAMNKL